MLARAQKLTRRGIGFHTTVCSLFTSVHLIVYLTASSWRPNDHTRRIEDHRHAGVISKSQAPGDRRRRLPCRPSGVPPTPLPQSATPSHLQRPLHESWQRQFCQW
jgi:hypothetical protein